MMFIVYWQLQVGVIENWYRVKFEVGVLDFGNLFFVIVDNFVVDDVSGVGVWQIGGKVVVFENGIVVFIVLFYQVGGVVFLVFDYLIIVLLDVGIFGIQI